MESLKQFRVSYKVTYHCWGYKGIFRREAYRFSVTFYNDPMKTLFYINARTEKEAIEIAETYIKKHIERYVEQSEKNQETGDYMILNGNIPPDGKFKMSDKIYFISGYEYELVSCKMVCDWSKERVERAAKELTMEQFKQIFNEIPTEIFK